MREWGGEGLRERESGLRGGLKYFKTRHQMAGFGKPQKHKKSVKQGASRSHTEEAIKQSYIKYQQGDLKGAKIALEKTLQSDQENSLALGFLATIEKALGNIERALQLFERSTNISLDNSDILHNYSGLLEHYNPEKAVILSDKAVHISPRIAITSKETDISNGKLAILTTPLRQL